MLIVFGLIVLYLTGLAVSVASFGWLAGKAGTPVWNKNRATIPDRSNLQKWELWGAWSPVWPLFLPAVIVILVFALASYTCKSYLGLFHKTQQQALNVRERQLSTDHGIVANPTRKQVL